MHNNSSHKFFNSSGCNVYNIVSDQYYNSKRLFSLAPVKYSATTVTTPNGYLLNHIPFHYYCIHRCSCNLHNCLFLHEHHWCTSPKRRVELSFNDQQYATEWIEMMKSYKKDLSFQLSSKLSFIFCLDFALAHYEDNGAATQSIKVKNCQLPVLTTMPTTIPTEILFELTNEIPDKFVKFAHNRRNK